jgi:hypothetical protein
MTQRDIYDRTAPLGPAMLQLRRAMWDARYEAFRQMQCRAELMARRACPDLDFDRLKDWERRLFTEGCRRILRREAASAPMRFPRTWLDQDDGSSSSCEVW